MIGDYLADVVAKREGRPLAKYTVPENQKGHWVSRRATNILADVRELDRACQKQGGTPLYDGHGIAEPERVVNISHASHRESFTIFINVVNRAFVEQIESIAKKRADKRYFWETLPNAYPTLYEALHRVKVYRNQELHLELNDITDKNLREFLKQDLDGRTPEKIEDGWFTLQQVILDNILLAIQVELSRVT